MSDFDYDSDVFEDELSDDFEDEEEIEEEDVEDEEEDVGDEDEEEEGEEFEGILNIEENETTFNTKVLQKPPSKKETERIGSKAKELQSVYRRMMAEIPRVEARTFSLSFLSEEEKEKMSTCIINKTKDTASTANTLYDERMGPIHPGMLCVTCNRTTEDCPGHYGLIKTPSIIHPLAENYIIYTLKSVCHSCGQLLVSDSTFKLREVGKYKGMNRLSKIADIASNKCTNMVTRNGKEVVCNTVQRKYLKGKNDNYIPFTNPNTEGNTVINLEPDQIFKIFNSISDENAIKLGFGILEEEIGYLEGAGTLPMHPRNFVLQSVMVPPNCVRPRIEENLNGTGNWTDSIDSSLKGIISNSLTYNKASQPDIKRDAAKNVWVAYRNILIGDATTTGRQTMSIKARFKGKSGAFTSVIGKRGENAARSVITGANWVGFGNVGVPRFAALRITYPERVFARNLASLQKDLRAGKVKYIISKTGKYAGFRTNVDERMRRTYKLQIGDIVRRSLRNGDLVWFGRQPSLSSGSLMALRVVITSDNTFQFGLYHTKTFGADFDGKILLPSTGGIKSLRPPSRFKALIH